MPDKLSLVLDGSMLELYVAEVELSGNRCAKTETEPENVTVPCWIDDNGNYRYLEHIIVYFKVPIEQLSPLYAFYDAAEEQQQFRTLILQERGTTPQDTAPQNSLLMEMVQEQLIGETQQTT